MEFTIFLFAWGGVAGVRSESICCWLLSGRSPRWDARRRFGVLGNLDVLLFDSNDAAAARTGESPMNRARRDTKPCSGQRTAKAPRPTPAAGPQLRPGASRRRAKHRRSRPSRPGRPAVSGHPSRLQPIPSARGTRTPGSTTHHGDADVRTAVTHIDDLMQLLTDGSAGRRLAAQNSLLNAGDSAIEPLLARFTKEVPYRRGDGGGRRSPAAGCGTDLVCNRRGCSPTRALGSGTGVGAIQVLGGLLEEESPDVRANAIGGLLRLESHKSVVAIGEILSDTRLACYALDGLDAPGQLVLRRAPKRRTPSPGTWPTRSSMDRWLQRAAERRRPSRWSHRSCLIPSSLHCPTSSPDGSR